MFNKIKSLVGGTPKQPRPPRENPNFITAPQRIVSLLNDITHQRIVIHFDLPGDEPKPDAEDMPSTFFKQVGSERAAIERLKDDELHARVLEADQIKVITDLYGAPLTFPTKVTTTQTLGEDEFYIIDLPTKVFYPENPEFRRFRVSAYKKISAYIKQVNQEKSVPGLLDTLSVTNIGIMLSSETSTLPHLRKGEKLNCALMVDGNNVKFEAIVENVKRLADDKSIRVDCSFGAVSKDSNRVINSIMLETEQFLRNRVR